MTTLTTEHRNEMLKAVSQSIISYRRRLAEWSGPPDKRHDIEESMRLLTEARNILEEKAA